jgi:opacity protein-like surface antigen
MKLKTIFTLFLTSILSQALFADKVEPPKDAVAFRGNHYKAFLDTNSTWWEAKFACDDIGGELVVITTCTGK